MEMKYVMVDRIHLIVCGARLSHKDRSVPKEGVPTSAGFVQFWSDASGRIRCRTFGHSASLKLGPDPRDAEIIETYFND